MKNLLTSILSMMLVFSVLLGAFAGCSKPSSDGDATASDDSADNSTEAPTDAPEATDAPETTDAPDTPDSPEPPSDDQGGEGDDDDQDGDNVGDDDGDDDDDDQGGSYDDDDGSPRMTPIMGWASWNAYHPNISEAEILSQAERLVEYGLADLGYTYVNIDDGWQYGRVDGVVQINEERFPNGMKYMADTIHSMGLKAGIYSDVGKNTCGAMHSGESKNTNVGLYGYEEEDLWRYLVEWGYDFIKVDWCGGGQLGLDKEESYTNLAYIIDDIEYETGKDKIYNVCCWEFPGDWVVYCADSWRTGADITNDFESIIYQINRIRDLAKYHGPGHVNDLDMLQIGNGMSYEEDKTHFAMWCMMSTPLMLGMDLNCISDETLSIISNAELIAINQDRACIQASPVKSYGEVEAWTKDLGRAGSGKKAIALLNTSSKDQTVTVYFDELGLVGVNSIRDVWAHEDIAVGGCYTVTVPAHGTCVYVASGTPVAAESQLGDMITTPDGSKPTASMKLSDIAATIDLSALGSYDWAHFAPSFTTEKDNGAGEITLDYDGTAIAYDGNASFVWSDADTASSLGSSKQGLGVNTSGAKLILTLPCDGNERELAVAIFADSAQAKIELIAGGKVIAEESLSAAAGESAEKMLNVSLSSDKATKAHLRITLTKLEASGGSVGISAAAVGLTPTANAIYSPEFTTDEGGTEVTFSYTAIDGAAAAVIELLEYESFLKKEIAISGAGAGTVREELGKLPALFSGRLRIYLVDADGNELCSYEKALTAAEVESYNVGPMTAKGLIADGAVLLDVRGAGEFERGHIDGAINLEYTAIESKIASVIPNKNTPIIVYCSAAKRSTQALKTLLRLGYTSVYNLGSMDNYYAEPTIAFSQESGKVITEYDEVSVQFIASPYDNPSVYISEGADSTFADAIPVEDFLVPKHYCYYYTLKAYLVQDGVCYAQEEKQFIYWSEFSADAFLGDMRDEWISSSIGWGSINIDKSVDGNPLKLVGKTYSKGIGTHAISEIVAPIPEGAQKFLAVVGQDSEIIEGTPSISDYYVMIFFVYIDGVLIDRTAQLGRGQSYVFDIDIPEGAKEITLFVHDGTYSGNNFDHADWAIAAFFNNAIED